MVSLLAFATDCCTAVCRAALTLDTCCTPHLLQVHNWLILPTTRVPGSKPATCCCSGHRWERQTDGHRTVTWTRPHTVRSVSITCSDGIHAEWIGVDSLVLFRPTLWSKLCWTCIGVVHNAARACHHVDIGRHVCNDDLWSSRPLYDTAHQHSICMLAVTFDLHSMGNTRKGLTLRNSVNLSLLTCEKTGNICFVANVIVCVNGNFYDGDWCNCLQCFDAVGWAAGRASSL